jgi:hypothetical protein
VHPANGISGKSPQRFLIFTNARFNIAMSTDYIKRLHISLTGDQSFRFFTSTGLHIATGFVRVVIGGRGPYVEFSDGQVIKKAIFVPEGQRYRLSSSVCYYDEWRTRDSANVKLYHQKAPVGYADYLVGMWYISPFDLFNDDGVMVICTIKNFPAPSLFDP